jgi:hypothetical protein
MLSYITRVVKGYIEKQSTQTDTSVTPERTSKNNETVSKTDTSVTPKELRKTTKKCPKCVQKTKLAIIMTRVIQQKEDGDAIIRSLLKKEWKFLPHFGTNI